jgi:hypothetical protein
MGEEQGWGRNRNGGGTGMGNRDRKEQGWVTEIERNRMGRMIRIN